MRRLTFAAVCGTLVLAACSDQTPTEPTIPPPEEHVSPRCRPATHFPIVQVSGLIVKVFPRGKLQLEALIRGAAIALYWETCRKPQAQKAAVAFVNFMNANSSRLTGTPAQRNTLISLILNGVGIPFITPPGGTADFGVGIFDPNNPNNTLVKTRSGVALIELEPGSFLEQTVIVISRRADDSDPLNFPDGNQFPPFWDYDAINASGDHVLANGNTALIAFCLLDTEVQTYPEDRRIGHNPVFGAPGFPFEILEAVDLAEERPDLVAQLNCNNLAPNTLVIGGFGHGLPGLANTAWKTASHYLAPAARALFLPEALHAATLALIKLPPPGARLPSMSPVGLVEFAEESEQPLELNLEAVEKLPGGTQRFTVQSGGPGPYIWSVNGVDGGNSTFGLIVIAEDDPNSADYTAPAEVPTSEPFDICARRQASPLNTACASVTILPVPSSGQDVVVFNDVDFFSDAADAPSNPNNQKMYQNLMEYAATGARAGQNGIMIHFGQQSQLWLDGGPAYVQGFIEFLTVSEYDVTVVDDPAALLGVIPPTIKVVVLVLPTVDYTDQQINTLKQFASEGGRIVFIGEHSDYYGAFIETVENPFFQDMGAELTNVGAFIDCGVVTLPQSSIREHQITTGMTDVTMGCASTMTLGPNDYGLISGSDGATFIAGLAKIDVTPLSINAGVRMHAGKALRVTKLPAHDPLGSTYIPRSAK